MTDRAGKTYYVAYDVRYIVPVLVDTESEEEMLYNARQYSEQILRALLGKWQVQSINISCVDIKEDPNKIKLPEEDGPIPLPHGLDSLDDLAALRPGHDVYGGLDNGGD